MRYSSTPEKSTEKYGYTRLLRNWCLNGQYPLTPLLAVSNASLYSQTKTCNSSIIRWFSDLWEIMSILILHSGAVHRFKCIRYGLGLNRVLHIWEVATISWWQAGLCHKPNLDSNCSSKISLNSSIHLHIDPILVNKKFHDKWYTFWGP